MSNVSQPKAPFKEKYDNFIGGEWRPPHSLTYFDNTSPITGQIVCRIARSTHVDVEAALDAAHAAKAAWGATSTTARANILNKIAQRMEDNLETIAVAEAHRLNIPIIAIVDTNADPAKVQFPIPGNDDAIRSIRIILQNLVDAMVAAKRN